eukprot:scpid98465/ scgid16298/ 
MIPALRLSRATFTLTLITRPAASNETPTPTFQAPFFLASSSSSSLVAEYGHQQRINSSASDSAPTSTQQTHTHRKQHKEKEECSQAERPDSHCIHVAVVKPGM